MQRLVLFLVFFVSTFYASGQNFKIPIPVKATFDRLYPNQKVNEWEMEDGIYEASFKKDQQEISVVMTSDGRLVQTETEISAELLPQALKDYVHTQFESNRISESIKIVHVDGTITYEAEIDDADYMFDEYGHFLGKEQEVTEDDEEEEEDK